MAATQPLPISSTEDGLVAPATTTPGWTTFRSETSAAGWGWVGLAQLAAGVDWERFRADIRDTVSDDQERIVKGMAALDRDAIMFGGAVIHPGRPAEFAVDLAPGRYVLFDYPDTASDSVAPRYRTLLVDGPPNGVAQPDAAGTIRAVRADGQEPRFEVLGTPTAGRPLGFENALGRPQVMEAVLFPLPERTGEAELAEFFAAFVDGSPDWPPDPPFDLAAGCGSLPLAADRSSLLRVTAGPGRYVVVDWLKDSTDGVRMAKRGHYRILELA